ncbi:DUF1684 domain-containing protein [Halocalculus aciditolerans]|uniref:DUF1684 domain-containing protein n=1 Tax=Halocalculus aciditolerans TaxID=1383812 RepID=A0A830FCJ5_9EURY|nr:DUF1684 domain-containing protein [Halocalculus aciditolerans]GGL61128.1 hypothetical protein GCM10009039_19100 [Halocalculus aciditolerans]
MAESDLDLDAWRDRVRDYRERKDAFLERDDDSPLAGRDGFDGLDYYEPDPEYRVVARYEPRQTPETVVLEMAKGSDGGDGPSEAEYEAAAAFGFTVGGEFTTLTGYRTPGQETLLVPFTDETTGDTTPAMGRYLDVDVEGVDARDEVALDFNLAYAPFAHYDDAYASPLPPTDNHVPARIDAGERTLD